MPKWRHNHSVKLHRKPLLRLLYCECVMTQVKFKLRAALNSRPQSAKTAKSRRITEEDLASLRAFRRLRLANRRLPHQPAAA